MAVRNKQVKRNTVLVKWKLQLPSSSTDVHLHWCRTKTDARRLLFQSSNTATASFQWVTHTQMHTHAYFNSAPFQNLNTSYQQLGYTRNARMYLGRYHMLLNKGVLQKQKSSRRVIIRWHAVTACAYLAGSWKHLKII